MASIQSGTGLYGGLLASVAAGRLFTDKAEIAAILRFEAALAEAEAGLGIIPQAAALRISAACAEMNPDPNALASATSRDGLPVPALVGLLRQAAGTEAGAYVHWGATSQDAIDTGLVLRLRSALDLMQAGLRCHVGRLATLAENNRDTLMVGRTRAMQATPTTFGLKSAGWMMPLLRQLRRLEAVRADALMLSFAGAVGNLSALQGKGPAVADRLARLLQLSAPPLAWHTQRDGLLVLANWCAGTAMALGKIGTDIALMAQSEVGELVIASGGGSSTMPNKVNPIAAETLVALARLAAGNIGTLHQAAIQEHERGGAGWTLEWMVLPQIVLAAAAAIERADTLLASLEVNADRMRANLQATNGLVFAEAVSFALAEKLPRPQAQTLVKLACQKASSQHRHLAEILDEDTRANGELADLDWADVFSGRNEIACASAMIDQALAEAQPFRPR